MGSSGEWELQFIKEDNIGYNAGSGLRISKAEGNLDLWYKLIINDNFADVFFTSETTGYSVANRVVYKTTNAGESWFIMTSFPSHLFTAALNSLTFTDSVTGFAGGPPCRIVKTTDAGNSWYVTNRTGLTDTLGTIYKFFFTNPNTGWAVTSRGSVLKSIDAGENWFVQLDTGISVVFQSIYFIDSLFGWIVSPGFGGIYSTTNGGTNWVRRMDIPIYDGSDVYFFSHFKGWIVSGNKLYYSSDGGGNWTQDPQIYTFSRNFETISNTHFIITGTNIYESSDTGIVWQNITSEVGNYFTVLHAPRNYFAIGVGSLGYIVSYLDTSIIPVELINFSTEQLDNKVLLKWTTATETNNYGFEILQSSDLQNWEKIGFAEGNGSTTQMNHYYFIERELSAGKYCYRLKQIDFDGSYEYSDIIEVSVLLNSFQLYQNFPNPFNPSTRIQYDIPSDTKVVLMIYDILGRKVKTLVNEFQTAGRYGVDFNASTLASGVYIYQLSSTGFVKSRKMMVLK